MPKSAGELVAAEGERSRNEWRSLHPALQAIIAQNEAEQKAAKNTPPDHVEKVVRSRHDTAYQSDPVASSVAVKVKGDLATGERSRR